MTLPYPCDAEVCLGLKDSVEETVEEYCDVAESKQITESESKSKCRTKKALYRIISIQRQMPFPKQISLCVPVWANAST